jgi:ligand-binding SRPBCC domain-containing protein
MYQGQLIEYQVQFMPVIKTRWLTEIAHVIDQKYFVDVQNIGPYKYWYHEHFFNATDLGGTQIKDLVTYHLPFGILGDFVHTVWIRNKLKGIFDYRYEKIQSVFGD